MTQLHHILDQDINVLQELLAREIDYQVAPILRSLVSIKQEMTYHINSVGAAETSSPHPPSATLKSYRSDQSEQTDESPTLSSILDIEMDQSRYVQSLLTSESSMPDEVREVLQDIHRQYLSLTHQLQRMTKTKQLSELQNA